MPSFPNRPIVSHHLLVLLSLSTCIVMMTASSQAAEPASLAGRLIQQHPENGGDGPDIRDNISAVVSRGDLLVLGADEGADVLLFDRIDEQHYQQSDPACIALDGQKCGSERKGSEVDIEGLAWGRKFLYVLGSHSRARNRVKDDKSQAENLRRLATVKIEPSREALYRVKLDENGKIGKKRKHISLRDLFTNHPLLSRFQGIPSKENGIDIEGLAVREVDGLDQLYLGFRGPVLRGNYALIMALQFKIQANEDKLKFKAKEISDAPIFYLNLGGRGIRGIAEAGDDGLLILAGPVGDAVSDAQKTRYPVYLWDGKQAALPTEPMQPLCYAPPLPSAPKAKAEGIELLNKDRDSSAPYRLLFVYDGAKRGAPMIINCGR